MSTSAVAPARQHRPGIITFLVVLAIIKGLIGIVAGIVIIAERNDAELIAGTRLTSSELLLAGIGILAIAAITLLVAYGLWVGSELARAVVAVLMILDIAWAAWGLWEVGSRVAAQASVTILLSLLILWILFGYEPAKRFFGGYV